MGKFQVRRQLVSAYADYLQAMRNAESTQSEKDIGGELLRRAVRIDPTVMAAAKRIKDLGG